MRPGPCSDRSAGAAPAGGRPRGPRQPAPALEPSAPQSRRDGRRSRGRGPWGCGRGAGLRLGNAPRRRERCAPTAGAPAGCTRVLRGAAGRTRRGSDGPSALRDPGSDLTARLGKAEQSPQPGTVHTPPPPGRCLASPCWGLRGSEGWPRAVLREVGGRAGLTGAGVQGGRGPRTAEIFGPCPPKRGLEAVQEPDGRKLGSGRVAGSRSTLPCEFRVQPALPPGKRGNAHPSATGCWPHPNPTKGALQPTSELNPKNHRSSTTKGDPLAPGTAGSKPTLGAAPPCTAPHTWCSRFTLESPNL